MFEIALAITGIVLIWLGIKFKPYIPPAYIPDELINIAYYSDLIKAFDSERSAKHGAILRRVPN